MNEDSYALVSAIRGPVLVITVGILFALDRLTQFGFEQTWPALLIVAGLLSIASAGSRASRRAAAAGGVPNYGVQPPYPGPSNPPSYPPPGAANPNATPSGRGGGFAGSPYAQPATAAKTDPATSTHSASAAPSMGSPVAGSPVASAPAAADAAATQDSGPAWTSASGPHSSIGHASSSDALTGGAAGPAAHPERNEPVNPALPEQTNPEASR